MHTWHTDSTIDVGIWVTFDIVLADLVLVYCFLQVAGLACAFVLGDLGVWGTALYALVGLGVVGLGFGAAGTG